MKKSLKNTKYFIRYYKKRFLIILATVMLLCGCNMAYATNSIWEYVDNLAYYLEEYYTDASVNDDSDGAMEYAEWYYAGGNAKGSSSVYMSVGSLVFYTLETGSAVQGKPTWDEWYALNSEKLQKGSKTKDGGALYNLICTMIDDIVSTDSIKEVEKLVTVEYDTTSITLGGYTITNMATVISSVNTAIQTFAIVFCATFFFVGLMNAFLTQQAYQEIIIKRLIVLGISVFCISWSMGLCLNIANLGSGIASEISGITNSTFDAQNDIIEDLKLAIYDETHTADNVSGTFKHLAATLGDWCTALGYLLQLFIPWIAMKAVNIIVTITCWGRAIEILILATLAPIAFCDISSGQGTGMGSMGRFLKNFAATALQGAIIVLIMFYCAQIHLAIIGESSSSASFLSNTWNIVVIGFVEVGLCTKSQGMSKQLVGAT